MNSICMFTDSAFFTEGDKGGDVIVFMQNVKWMLDVV